MKIHLDKFKKFLGKYISPSYSQCDEDKIIAQHFAPDYKGICIDIGAADGIGLSNTYYFEKHGWKCVCVEPNPWMFEKLNKNRKHAINAAVGLNNNREVDFKVVTLQGGNQTAISSLEVDQRLMQSHAHFNPQINIIKVQERTLDSILKDFDWISHVDFVTIDTEGTELDVLKGFNIDKWSPKLFCIENNFNDPEITGYLEKFRYKKILRNEVNDFYEK